MTVTPEFGFPLPSDQSRIVKFPSHLRTLSTTLEEKLPGAVTAAARAEYPLEVGRQTRDIRSIAATAAMIAREAERESADLAARLDALQSTAGMGPSTPEDGTAAALIGAPGTLAHTAATALASEIAGVVRLALDPEDGARNRAVIEAALNEHPDRVTVIPAGVWPVVGSIAPTAGCRLRGEGRHASILTTTNTDRPVLDLVDVQSPPVIEHLGFTATAEKATIGGGFRGGAAMSFWAAIFTNTHRTTVRDVYAEGFCTGVYVLNWDTGQAARRGHVEDVTVEDVLIEGVDFGVLAAGHRRLSIRRARGRYELSPGSGNPAHLVYLPENHDPDERNYDTIVSDCEAWNGTGGKAYSFKYIHGLTMRDLRARRCDGLYSVSDCEDVTGDNLRSLQDVTPSIAAAGSVRYVAYHFGKSRNVNISGLTLDLLNDTPAVRWESTGGTLEDVTISVTRGDVNSTMPDVGVYGDGTTVRNVAVLSNGTGVGRANAVQIIAGRHDVEDVTANSAVNGVAMLAGAQAGSHIRLDPARINISAGGRVFVNSSAGRVDVVLHEAIAQHTASAMLNIPVRADMTNRVEVTIRTAEQVTLSTPVGMWPGATLTYELTNAHTDPALLRWAGVFKLSDPLTAIPAGTSRTLTFRWNGTAWIEQARA